VASCPTLLPCPPAPAPGDPSRALGPGAQRAAVPGTWCPAVPAASRQSLAIPRSSPGSRRLSARGMAFVPCPHPIGRHAGCVWWQSTVPPGRWRVPGERQGVAWLRVPRQPTSSGSRKGPGSRREGRGAPRRGGAAADSLTSGNRNLFPGSPLPPPTHPSPRGTAQQPLGMAGCTLQAPPPRQHPTAQHQGKQRAARGRWHGWALLAPTQGLAFSATPRAHSQAGREPRHAAAPVSRQPKGHLCPGTPRTAGAGPPGPDTAHVRGSSGTGQRGGKPSPSPANRAGIQGRVGLQRVPSPRRRRPSQRGACCQPDAACTLIAHCHARPPLPRHTARSGWHRTVRAPGRAWGGRSLLPVCPAMRGASCPATCCSRKTQKTGPALGAGAREHC